jgi:hypothetical protein
MFRECNSSDDQHYDQHHSSHDVSPHGQSASLHKETNRHNDDREYYCGLDYVRQRHVSTSLSYSGSSIRSDFGFFTRRQFLPKRESKPCEFCNKIRTLLLECLKAPFSRSDLSSYVHVGIPYLVTGWAPSVSPLHFLHGKSSVGFGPYSKTKPHNGENHKGEPDGQQTKHGGNHQNDCDQ